MKKRLLSMLMAVLMIASLVPATALAATDNHANHDVLTVSIDANAANKQPGITFKYCNTCGEVLKAAVVSPFVDAKDTCSSHKHVTTKVLQEGSCELAKITVTYCSDCGNPVTVSGTQTTSASAVKVDKTNIGKHSYSKFEVSYQPTCTKDGWGYTKCDKCGEPAFVYGADTTREGSKTPVSALDYLYYGKTYTEVKTSDADKVYAMFAAKGHENTDKLVTPTENVYVDTWYRPQGDSTGYIVKKLVAKAAIEPTHAQTVSGKAVVDASGKVTPVEVYTQTMAATKWLDPDNTGAGRTADVYCPDCLKVISKSTAKASLNEAHDMVRTALGYYPYMDAAGVKHDGVTDTWHCTTCGEDFGGVKIAYADFYKTTYYNTEWAQHVEVLKNYIGTTNNTYGYVTGDQITINVVAATCQTEGSTGHKLIVYKKTNGDLDFNTVSSPETTDKTAHTWSKVESKAATCQSDGWTVSDYYVCVNDLGNGKLCNAAKPSGVVISAGPAAPDYVARVLVEATCESKGLTVLVDSTCGDLKYRHNTVDFHLKDSVKYIDKVPHKAGELQNVKEATCTELGYTGDTFCAWCNTKLSTGKEIPMKDHTWVDVEAVAPTCGKDGSTAGKKCSVCETTEGIEVDPATGKHDYKVENAKEATCTEEGYTGDKTCTVCGDVVKGEVIPAAKHNYVDGVCTVCKAKDETYNPFKDLKETDSFYKDILWAWQNNIVNGNDKGEYDAAGTLTRAQVVQMLWNANGQPKAAKAASFSDVKEGDWWADAVAWAVEAGFISGYGDGKFGPNDACTRAQFVKMLWVINGSPKAAAADFSDVAADAWYAAAVAWAAETKVTLGDGAGHFLPEDSCTRGQAVAFLHRAPSLVVKTAE